MPETIVPGSRLTRWRCLETPTGPFALLQRDDGSLETMWIETARQRRLDPAAEDRDLLPEIAERLAAYFRGEAVSFDDVPLPPGGGFFRRCRAACRTVPRGATVTYAELAQMAGGSRRAARAAGQAMRRNPQPIITPCHRVIGSRGDLHGFGGSAAPDSAPVSIKRALLKIEAAGTGQW